MEGKQGGSRIARGAAAFRSGIRGAFPRLGSIFLVILPISLGVSLLDWLGLVSWIARLTFPLPGLIGLPGEASLVLAASAFLSVYGSLAVALSLHFDMREATILAMLCLIAHNLVVETAQMKRTGSSRAKMLCLRLWAAIVAAFVFNALLPAGLAAQRFTEAASSIRPSFGGMLLAWG